jgi:hypothetical protein
MRCKDFEQHLEDWLAGEAAPEFLQHLRACSRCRALAEDLAPTGRWVSALRLEAPGPGPDFWARLQEQLEASERRADFWAALGWAAGRAAWALTVVLLLFAFWVLREPAEPSAVAAFDAPQNYVEDGTLPPVGNGQLDRSQVLLTLVSAPEVQK